MKTTTNKRERVPQPAYVKPPQPVRIILKGYEAKVMSSEKYKKTLDEKEELKKAKSNYNTNMRVIYGNDWKKLGHTNVSVKVNQQTSKFELI
jgi:hypothetical protein